MTPEDRLAELSQGRNPKMVARMPSGFLVMGDYQFFEGYCLLLAYPMAGKLNDLRGGARDQFLDDMARAGDAILDATGCARINYSIYGNLDPFLHAHLWPRYEDEDIAYRTIPPFLVPAEVREAAQHAFSPEAHRELMNRIAAGLQDHA